MLRLKKTKYGGYPLWQDDASMPALTQSTHVVWQQLEPILVRIDEARESEQFTASPPFSLPARLELIWDRHHSHRQGLVMFDSQGQLIVHVVHALLGYDGSGPQLSKQILTHLGVGEAMFEQIQHEVRDRPYLVVLSRQKRRFDQGITTTYPTHEVEGEWEYWDASKHLS